MHIGNNRKSFFNDACMRYILPILVFYITLIPIFSIGQLESYTLIIIHMAISAICSIALFIDQDKPYSFYKIFHLFYLFFFCIAPIIQFKNNIRLLGTNFTESEYIYTSSVLLIVLIIFDIVYYISYHKIEISYHQVSSLIPSSSSLSKIKISILLIISVAISFYFFYINNFNISSLFIRSGIYVNRIHTSQMVILLTNNFLRPVTMIIFSATYMLNINKIYKILFFILFLFSCPITGMARYAAAALYLPVALIVFPILKKRNLFVLSMIIGLLVFFPFLDYFRNFNEHRDIALGFNFSQFEQLHFDSYSMFMRVTKDNIITYGNQLLGVLFFWVPRTFWPNKPVGSGVYIAGEQHLFFDNISMPYFGEGYINFGLIGVIFFTIFLAVFIAKIDKNYWNIDTQNNINFQQISYIMGLSLFLFVLRGDLMSSFAYTCGYVASYWFTIKLIKS